MENVNKFKSGDSVSYTSGMHYQNFTGIVEKAINNYKGKWDYLVKDDTDHIVKRVEEKYLQIKN